MTYKKFVRSIKIFYRAHGPLWKTILVVFVVFLAILIWKPWIPRPRTLTPAEIMAQQENTVADIVQEGNIENCAKAKGITINGVDYEKVCEYNVALANAQKNLDLSSCDKVGAYDSASKMPCQLNIILTNVARSDQDVCATLNDSQLKSYCYVAYWREAAIRKSDINICQKIESTEGTANCRTNFYIDNLVFQKKNISCSVFAPIFQTGCSQLKTSRAKSVAKNLAPSCLEIDDTAFQALCQDRESVINLMQKN